MSICPKNKSSKARRDKRRANWKMSAPNLVKCSKCGELMMPHRVCKACGSYNKKEIEKRSKVKVGFTTGKVLFKETIQNTVIGVGHFEPLRHYAEVHLKLEPLPRGKGLVFESNCSNDDLALNWQNLILTHLKEKQHKGVLTGSPSTDIKITLVAGKAHLKHTEGGDFRQAT